MSHLSAEAMQKFFAPIGALEQQIAAARFARARGTPLDGEPRGSFQKIIKRPGRSRQVCLTLRAKGQCGGPWPIRGFPK